MDPQKDFIHIDDLFKNLRNGEEQERSGSWLQMKELLDKEMPVGSTVSGGRSFRRLIIPLIAAVALIGGGVGYHEWSKEKTNTVQLASGNKSTGGTTAAGADVSPNQLAGGSNHSLPEGREADKNNVAAIADNGNKAGTTATARNASGNISGNPDQHIAAHANTGGRETASGKPGKTTPGATHQPIGTHKIVTVPVKKTIAGQEQAMTAADNITEERVIEETGPLTKGTVATATHAAGNNKETPAITPGANSKKLKQLALSLNNKKIVTDTEGTLYKEQRDTFKRIDLVERIVANSGNGRRIPSKTVLDTVAVTRIEKIRYVPLDRIELASLRQMGVDNNPRKLIPVTNLHDRILAKETVSLVPLNHYKVASRRVDPGKFNQLVQNTSAGISNYFDGSRNFYAALIIGGNASFGNPGAFGMQLGIAGLYSLSERLTLSAELKYVNHYFSNYSLEDKSVTFENVNSQQVSGMEWLFSGTQNTMTSSYKINSFGALEMPITLNYNLGRVSLFAGLNMAYAFPVKWSKENTYSTTNVQQTRSQNQNPFLNSSFQVDEQKDFVSRLGLGYVWGLNYEISRKVSLDARVAQILWDNSNSNTEAINRLFRIPTMQFSIGYYFGRKDKVVYIMDKR